MSYHMPRDHARKAKNYASDQSSHIGVDGDVLKVLPFEQ
jgi:hypothetical protein